MAVGTVNAEPLKLTDTQMDMVTAGVGANNVAIVPWAALIKNHTLGHNGKADNNNSDHLGGVAVPSAVPAARRTTYATSSTPRPESAVASNEAPARTKKRIMNGHSIPSIA